LVHSSFVRPLKANTNELLTGTFPQSKKSEHVGIRRAQRPVAREDFSAILSPLVEGDDSELPSGIVPSWLRKIVSSKEATYPGTDELEKWGLPDQGRS
jgi:hypothetical protein